MSGDLRTRAQRRDRWVDLVIVALVALALILGWVLKTVAETRTVLVEESGLQVRYPANWLRMDAQAPALIEVQDSQATGLATTLTLQRRPLPSGSGQLLASVQQGLSLERGSLWMGYRVLKVEEGIAIAGRQGLRVSYAYVESNPNPFLTTVPVVMRGEDYIFARDGQAYVFTLTAAEANYGRSQGTLQTFVRSWK
jgi:hypothetical protein